jgi:hypothetical protein
MEKGFTGVKDTDLEILMRLDDRSLLNTCSIENVYLKRICNDESFWKRRFVSRFGEVASRYIFLDFYTKYIFIRIYF